MNVEQFFLEIRERVATYGRYAVALQPFAYSTTKGDEPDNPGRAALTDVDFIVQEGLLREFLARGYRFSIFAEEESPYVDQFPKDGNVIVSIDPIDGTNAYRHKMPSFCVVIAVYKNGEIAGAMVHTPRDGKFYCATQEREMAWTWIPETPENSYREEEFRCAKSQDKVVLTYKPDPLAEAAMENRGIQVNRFDRADKLDLRLGLNSVLRGELAAYFRSAVPCLDWGPISFIVEKGGGRVTDFRGKMDDLHRYWNRPDGYKASRLPSIIVSNNPELHDVLIEILGGKPV